MTDPHEEYYHDQEDDESHARPRGLRRVGTPEGTQILWDCGPGSRPSIEVPCTRAACAARSPLAYVVYLWGAGSRQSEQRMTDYAE